MVISDSIGRGEREIVRRATHTALVTSVFLGIVVGVLGEFLAPELLALLNTPEDVFPYALLYLRIYMLGMPVILLYNFESAIFRSAGDAATPLAALAISGVLNVLLNLFFVIVLQMTVEGVAIVFPMRSVRRFCLCGCCGMTVIFAWRCARFVSTAAYFCESSASACPPEYKVPCFRFPTS